MAEITGGELNYVVTADVEQLKKTLSDGEGRLVGFSSVAEKAGEKLDTALKGTAVSSLKELANEATKTGSTLKSVGDVKIDFGLTKENLAIQKQVIAEIKKNIEEIEKRAKDMAPGIGQATVIAEAKELRRELDAEQKSLAELESALKSTATSTTTLSTKYLQAKNALAELTLANKQGTPEFIKAEAEVKRLGLALNETNKNAKNLSSGSAFTGVIQGASLLSGGLAAAQSVMGLFGGENENLNKIMLKTQALMSVSITLQQLQTSVTSGGILSTTTLTTAKNFLAAANLRLATALGISTAAATALMATLTLGLSVAIAGVIYLMSQYGRETEKTIALNKKIAESVAEPLYAYKQLQMQYNALADDMKAKEQFVIDNKDAFSKLGYEVNTVSDAEKFLVSESANFVKAMTLRAEAAANAQIAMESFKKSILDEKEYRRKYIDKDLTLFEKLDYGPGGTQSRSAQKAAAEEIRKGKQDAINLTAKQIELDKKANALTANSGLKRSGGTTIKIKPGTTQKNTTNSPRPIKEDEIFLDGSLADLRKKLSEIEQAFSKTNDEITRDTLNQQKIVIEGQIKAIEDKYVIKEDEAAKEKADLEKKLQEFLVSQRNYEEKVIALKENYAKLRSVATTEEERSKIDAGLQADLQKLASDEIKKTKAWIDAFGEIEIYTAAKLAEVRSALLNELKRIETEGNATPEAIKAVQDQIQKLDALIRKRNPLQYLFESVQQYVSDLKDLKQAQDQYNDSIKTYGVNSDEAAIAAENLKKAQSNIADSKNKSAAALKEGASEVKSYLGDVRGIITDTKGAFDDLGVSLENGFGDVLEKLDGYLAGMEMQMDGMIMAAEGFITGNPVKIVAGAIKAVAGLVKSISSIFNNDRKKERDIKKQQEILSDLTVQYNELAFAADRAFGSMKYEGQRDLIKNLQDQKIAIEAMMRTEQSKKKGDKDKVEGYKSQIQNINQSIEQLKESIVKDILQTDFKDAASKIGDALVEAFGRGEDSVKSLEAAANDMLKNLLKNQLNLALQKPMQKLLDNLLLSAGFNPDGTGSFNGLTPEKIADFKAQVVALGQSTQGFFDGLSDIFGGVGGDAQGLKGDIKGVTEKTAGALEAYANVSRIMKAEDLALSRNNQLLFVQSLQNLVMIEANTRPLHRIDKNIDEMNSKMKNGLAGL